MALGRLDEATRSWKAKRNTGAGGREYGGVPRPLRPRAGPVGPCGGAGASRRIHGDGRDMAGGAALRDLNAGFVDDARAQADSALATNTGRNVVALAALVFARSGRKADVERLATQLEGDYPQFTLVQRYWLPSICASLALARNDWKMAIAALEAAIPLSLARRSRSPRRSRFPPYLRRLAYQAGKQWKDAALEFEKIASRPHLVGNNPIFPIARAALEKVREVGHGAPRHRSGRPRHRSCLRKRGSLHRASPGVWPTRCRAR